MKSTKFNTIIFNTKNGNAKLTERRSPQSCGLSQPKTTLHESGHFLQRRQGAVSFAISHTVSRVVSPAVSRAVSRVLFALICMIIVLAVSNLVSAADCAATLSAPTKQVYVGELFNISYFNAEINSTGQSLTLTLPAGLSTSSQNPITNVQPFTLYSWVINSTATGSYTVIANLSNCSKTLGINITNPPLSPNLGINISTIPTLILNSPQNFNVQITNAGPGNAYNINGILTSFSGATLISNLQNPFTIPVLGVAASNNTNTQTVTITPRSCGTGDLVGATISNYEDSAANLMSPVSAVSNSFNIIGSDVAFTGLSTSTDTITEGRTLTLTANLKNIGAMNANNAVVMFYDNRYLGRYLGQTSVGTISINESKSVSFTFNTAGMTIGVNTVVAVLNGSSECSADNNKINTSVTISAGSCSDGLLNNGETQVDCGGPNCNACPGVITTGGGGGGGSGGGGTSGKHFYYLSFAANETTKTMELDNLDSVLYNFNFADYTFHFKRFDVDRAVMGLSSATEFTEFILKPHEKLVLDLDKDDDYDLGVEVINASYSESTVQFSLFTFLTNDALFKLPATYVVPIKTPSTNTTDGSVKTITVLPTQNTTTTQTAASTGSVTVQEASVPKKTFPYWIGILITAVIVIAGLVTYFLLRKKLS